MLHKKTLLYCNDMRICESDCITIQSVVVVDGDDDDDEFILRNSE